MPVQETIDQINLSLGPLGLEIRKGISEKDASTFYAMCNQKTDEGAKLMTHFKANELLYFRSLVRHRHIEVFFQFGTEHSVVGD